MYDKELVTFIFQQIQSSLFTISQRFENIKRFSDFNDTDEGTEKLDSICMQFIAIGESLKNIDKITGNTLLNKYPEINWKGVKKFRDILSHHYFDIDAEEIYWLCSIELPKLLKTVKIILTDLKNK